MYIKILVPLDGSELAEQILPYARVFAEGLKIPVHLMHVDEPGATTAYAPPLGGGDYLAAVAARFFSRSIPVSQQVEHGKPAEVIVERAGAESGTLIAMATHGLSGLQRLLLGSVAYKVVHMAKNPLLLIRPEQARDPMSPVQLNALFVPLDGSGLAEAICPVAIDLALCLNLEVSVVRVYMPPAESAVIGDGVILDVGHRLRERIREEVATYLDGKVQQLQADGVRRVSSIAIEGDAAGEIIDLARKTPNNLIAMSTHGRSGIQRWVLGSVAEKVIQHSGDPVLVVRPS
jgi:nucleotide-binding universal stress UspA family protein